MKKGEIALKEKRISKQAAKVVTSTLNKMLKVEANSTSCSIVYQPKAPKALERFKNERR